MVFMVGVDFALTGLLIATCAYFLTKRFLRGRRTVGVSSDVISGVGEEPEFGYCFDVHCNSFFPVFVFVYVVQFLIMPLLIRDLWYPLINDVNCRISMFLGNTLYAVALIYYTYITFLGYNCKTPFGSLIDVALHFLSGTQILLVPIPVILVLYIISLFGFHVSKTVVETYFQK
jgi:UNC-50 family